MAVKRRTIWMDDEDWRKLGELAKAHEISPSSFIRASMPWGGGFIVPHEIAADVHRIAREMETRPNPYRAMVAGNTHPFTPVPKPGKRK